MLRIVWTDEAVEDLETIAAYVAARNLPAARRLTGLIFDAIERLGDYPHAYRIGRVEGTREAVVHPNYIVVYRVDTLVRVLAIVHASRQYP